MVKLIRLPFLTAVKTRWGLSVDQREADALHRLAADCPNETLTVTLAR